MEDKLLYYQDQSNWSMSDFYNLNRYLNRLLNYESDLLNSMDLTKMSDITKVLLVANIKTRGAFHLLEKPNLSGLNEINPLKERLNLEKDPINCYPIYDYYNVGW